VNDRVGKRAVQELKQVQLELNRQITMLQEESRRLRAEIEQVQVVHKTFLSNGLNITTARTRIGFLQKNIQAELDKLSVVAPSPVAENDSLPMAPPPPPASPPPSPPLTSKMAALKSEKSKDASPKKTEDVRGDLLKAIGAGKTLKSDNDRTNQQSEQDESVLYESSIHLKENEVTRLVEQINEFLNALETEKAIAQEYEEELEKQSELMLKLQQIEDKLEEEFKKVQEEVDAELTVLEEHKALAKQEQLTEDEALVKKEEAQSVEFDAPPPSAPPPPAPTFAPVSNSFKLKVKAVKASGEEPMSQVMESPSKAASGQQATVSADEIALRSRESQKRRESLDTKNYLAAQLIELVVKESVTTEDKKVKYSPEQEQLILSLGEKEYQELKTRMAQSLESDMSNAMSEMEKGAAHRRAALKRTPEDLALIAGLRDKAKLKDTVVAFIDNIENSNLLQTVKGMKQAQEERAQKAFEEQQKEEARKREERDKELEAAQKIKAEEKAAFVKSELSKLGIKEGVVNPEAIKRVAAEKAARAQSAGAEGVQDVVAFVESVDKELRTKIELFKAAALQTIESAAMKPPEGEIPHVSEEESLAMPPPEDDAPQIPEDELLETTNADKNSLVEEPQTDNTEHVTLDFDEIERALAEIDQQLAQDSERQLEQNLHEIEQGINEIDQQLAQDSERQLEQNLHEIEQGLNEIDQQLAQDSERQLEQNLHEIEQGLNEIDQQLAQDTSRQLEQDLKEIEQGLSEIEQQLAKPQPKPLERVEQKLRQLAVQQDNRSNLRRDLLDKSDFNVHLDGIKKAAEDFVRNKKPFAAKETNILYGKLLQARDEFIKTGDGSKFVRASNNALANHETRYLAQNEGVLQLLKRTVNFLQNRVLSIVSKSYSAQRTKQLEMQNDENLHPNAAVTGKAPVAIRSMKSVLKKLQEVNTDDDPEARSDLLI
jgi:hypothetical protein